MPDDTDPLTCWHCNGTGDGLSDNPLVAHCAICNGKGTLGDDGDAELPEDYDDNSVCDQRWSPQ